LPTGSVEYFKIATPPALTDIVPRFCALLPLPAVKVTVPVGVPLPLPDAVTVAVNVTWPFSVEGFGVEAMSVFVFDFPTVCERVPALLANAADPP
jgi:hypothetical protein